MSALANCLDPHKTRTGQVYTFLVGGHYNKVILVLVLYLYYHLYKKSLHFYKFVKINNELLYSNVFCLV